MRTHTRGKRRAAIGTTTLAILSLLVAIAAHAQDRSSFKPIFDGQTLDGWSGDPQYWRVEDGMLVGEVTPDTILQQNSWIVWEDGEVADFELTLEYRISAEGNSGIGYRCAAIPGEPYAVRGYQADIHGGDLWTGINYEERGRTFLAMRGMIARVPPGERPVLESVFAEPDALQRFVKKEDWNHYHLIVRGNRMQHFLNGVLMSEVTDLDPVNGTRKGLLGVQVHVGPPMKVEYRNILLKQLPPVETPELSPEELSEIPRVSFDNPDAMKHLIEESEKLR